jgi:hypothetical protein
MEGRSGQLTEDAPYGEGYVFITGNTDPELNVAP